MESGLSFHEFMASLQDAVPPPGIPVQLKSLWLDANGRWDDAHAMVDQLGDQRSARVHAYLHRKEGDSWNADYWYRRAQEERPGTTLQKEWEELVMRYTAS